VNSQTLLRTTEIKGEGRSRDQISKTRERVRKESSYGINKGLSRGIDWRRKCREGRSDKARGSDGGGVAMISNQPSETRKRAKERVVKEGREGRRGRYVLYLKVRSVHAAVAAAVRESVVNAEPVTT
jgi:hypothetical protein